MTDERPFRITKHALERGADMGIAATEIRDAYYRAEEVWHSPKYGYQMRARGRITLSINMQAEPPAIITILWSTQELWEESYQNSLGRNRGPGTPEQMAHLTRRKGT